MELIKQEFSVDLLEFFDLIPLPGSEDHLRLVSAGTLLDRDLNKYDLNHATSAAAPPSTPRKFGTLLLSE